MAKSKHDQTAVEVGRACDWLELCGQAISAMPQGEKTLSVDFEAEPGDWPLILAGLGHIRKAALQATKAPKPTKRG